MGPILKTLIGLCAFVWSVVGIVFLAGMFVVALQAPKLVDELTTSLSGVSNLVGGDTANFTNQTPAGVTPEMQACVEKALGKEALADLKSKNGEPSAEQRQAFEKCGFKPDNQAGQQSFQPISTPTN